MSEPQTHIISLPFCGEDLDWIDLSVELSCYGPEDDLTSGIGEPIPLEDREDMIQVVEICEIKDGIRKPVTSNLSDYLLGETRFLIALRDAFLEAVSSENSTA